MRKIKFIWSGCTFEGNIVSQEPSNINGLKTNIKTDNGEFTIYGKCEVGNCGPFKVLSITNQ